MRHNVGTLLHIDACDKLSLSLAMTPRQHFEEVLRVGRGWPTIDSGGNRSTASDCFERQLHGDEFMVGYDRTGSTAGGRYVDQPSREPPQAKFFRPPPRWMRFVPDSRRGVAHQTGRCWAGGLHAQQSALEQGFQVAASISNQQHGHLVAVHAVDHAVGFEEHLPIALNAQDKQLRRVGAALWLQCELLAGLEHLVEHMLGRAWRVVLCDPADDGAQILLRSVGDHRLVGWRDRQGERLTGSRNSARRSATASSMG